MAERKRHGVVTWVVSAVAALSVGSCIGLDFRKAINSTSHPIDPPRVAAETHVAVVQPKPNWFYDVNEDSMNGKRYRSALRRSDNELSLGFPYEGANRGTLLIRESTQGTLASIGIQKGQIICRYSECNIKVRFDDAQPLTFRGVGPADHSSNLLFFGDAQRFINGAKKASRIRVELTIYQEGSQLLEFNVEKPLVWPPRDRAQGSSLANQVTAHTPVRRACEHRAMFCLML